MRWFELNVEGRHGWVADFGEISNVSAGCP